MPTHHLAFGQRGSTSGTSERLTSVGKISETSKNAKKNNRKKQIFLTEIQIFSNFDLASVASSLQEQNNNQDAKRGRQSVTRK